MSGCALMIPVEPTCNATRQSAAISALSGSALAFLEGALSRTSSIDGHS
jgi:hypothetical protein